MAIIDDEQSRETGPHGRSCGYAGPLEYPLAGVDGRDPDVHCANYFITHSFPAVRRGGLKLYRDKILMNVQYCLTPTVYERTLKANLVFDCDQTAWKLVSNYMVVIYVGRE